MSVDIRTYCAARMRLRLPFFMGQFSGGAREHEGKAVCEDF
jgi:hypothetical protein